MTTAGSDGEKAGAVVPAPEAGSDAPEVWVHQPACVAFQLGWDMTRLYSVAIQRKRFTYDPGWKLPGQGNFKGPLHALDMERRLVSVSAGLVRMEGVLAAAGIERPSARTLLDRYRGDATQQELRDAIYRLHVATLIGMQAADPRLGSAYNLGRALCDTALDTDRPFTERFRHHRIKGLCSDLTHLAASFPPHAAEAVSRSLCLWRCVVEGRPSGERQDELQKAMPQQAEAWRGLLSGEERGTDLLGTEDYLEAGRRLVDQAGSMAWKVARSYWAGLVLAVLAVVAGLMLAVRVGGVGGVIAGIGVAASALGVSWKGIATTLATLADRLRAPLWGAELDRAIGDAVCVKEGREAYRELPKDEQRCDREMRRRTGPGPDGAGGSEPGAIKGDR